MAAFEIFFHPVILFCDRLTKSAIIFATDWRSSIFFLTANEIHIFPVTNWQTSHIFIYVWLKKFATFIYDRLINFAIFFHDHFTKFTFFSNDRLVKFAIFFSCNWRNLIFFFSCKTIDKICNHFSQLTDKVFSFPGTKWPKFVSYLNV